jgi:hypothetical protein
MIDTNKFTQIADGIWYENDTGLPWSNRKPGSHKGYYSYLSRINSKDKDGYFKINIEGKTYRWHRLVFNYFKGNIPDGVIDHKDNTIHNNKGDNLQIVSETFNKRKRKIQSNNTTGCAGVSFEKSTNKYRPQISVNGRTIHLGSFNNLEDAYEAYLQAKIKYHGAESIAPLNNKEK